MFDIKDTGGGESSAEEGTGGDETVRGQQ